MRRDKPNFMNKILGLFVIFCFCCAEPPKAPYVLPDDPIQLIAGNDSKTWKLAKRTNNGDRMNMGDCFLSFKQTYRADMTLSDNNGEQNDCGDSLHANWELIKDEKGHNFIKMTSPQIPKLLNIKEDHKQFKILHLAENEMKIAYYHKQFSDRTTTIVDYMVPEDVEIKDRDFHW